MGFFFVILNRGRAISSGRGRSSHSTVLCFEEVIFEDIFRKKRQKRQEDVKDENSRGRGISYAQRLLARDHDRRVHWKSHVVLTSIVESTLDPVVIDI